MIALIQRVNYARLSIDKKLHAEIETGLLALIGIEKNDDSAAAEKLLKKILAYRVFGDDSGKMNLSLQDIGGGLMLVSQFTLAASTDKGLRPGFSSAMPPADAEILYDEMLGMAQAAHSPVVSGVFAADMNIALENNGPVTFSLRS